MKGLLELCDELALIGEQTKKDLSEAEAADIALLNSWPYGGKK